VTTPSTPLSKRHPLSYDEAVLAWLADEDDAWRTAVRDRSERRAC
jgi:hypothetical protein